MSVQNYDSKYGFTNGQWVFLIFAACTTSIWRILSSTQLLSYSQFFWGHVLFLSLGSICLLAFPFAFQEGFFAKSTMDRLFRYEGVIPLILALVQPMLFLSIGRLGLRPGESWLLPYSPLRQEFGGQNYPYTPFIWCVLWLPVFLSIASGIFLIGLVLSVPKRIQRIRILAGYFCLLGITSICGTLLATHAYGTGIFGSNKGDSSTAMVIFNEILSLFFGGYILLKIEAAFRPSLLYLVASGIFGYLTGGLLKGPMDLYGAGSVLISTALSLWIIEAKMKAKELPEEEGLQSD